MYRRNADFAKRLPLIDGLKACAVQLIVLHHIAAYGPLAEAANRILPDLMDWLYDYGRMAVQIFLVLGGYLAARTLSPGFTRGRMNPALQFVATAVKRYLRLVLPFLAALLLAMLCAAVARRWMIDEDFIPAAPTLDQFIAHSLLLHSLLDYEALTTGVWYVAIDFQLFVLLAALLWIGECAAAFSPKLRHLPLVLVTALTLASLFCFNRDSTLDAWAPYFFNAYGVGALSYWAAQRQRNAALALLLIFFLAPFALIEDFRWRVVVALATALVVVFADAAPLLLKLARSRLAAHLGRTSYALFLAHFPLYLLASALCVRFNLLEGDAAERNAILALLAIWAASLYAATQFHRWIELPSNRLRLTWLEPHRPAPAVDFRRESWQSN